MLSLPMFTNLIKKENRKNNKNMIKPSFYRYNYNEVLDWNIILTSFQFIVHSILNQNKWSQYPWWLKGFVHKFGIRFSKKKFLSVLVNKLICCITHLTGEDLREKLECTIVSFLFVKHPNDDFHLILMCG